MTCKFERPQEPKQADYHTSDLIKKQDQDADYYPVENPTSPFTQLLNSLQSGLSFSLAHNLRDASMAYFLTSYIYATPFQGYVPLLCLDDPDLEDACSITISATALAAYSRRVRSAEYLESARQKYAIALSEVNKLLSKPETAILDRTLASVLVLGLFEAIVFEGGKSPTSWTAHTFGSMQLLRLRGPQQFKSTVSRKMFAHASNNIKTSCIQRSVPVPDDFIAFDEQVLVLHDPNEPTVKLSPMIHQVASIKARSIASPDCNLVHEALSLDHEIVTLCKNCPSWMAYSVEPASDSAAWAYERICHRYPSARIAKLWNAIRLLRIFLAVFIRDVATGQLDCGLSRLNLPDSKVTREKYLSQLHQYAEDNMRIVTTEVLASIPSFMETDDFGRRFSPAGRSLAWPLGIIENTKICGTSAQKYAYKYLDMLAGDLNLPQAVHPSRFVDSREDW
ncbi:C6 zinc finger domain-containing protein [Pochonia chlamydosporia 170]|uniref:C6 zinc finger domain-containing protein n=1 Tax=Pochonia chlamydosporia 170 TaxID=1380566 RepID=A0A179FN53_METCM|nr:C6 zinc finger domain-containing protein [Pochonia chlamydosporia 170]OAQ66581.1 C6 zinc finger domain-containing protein [Pochonia chlamydosporia 170]